MAITVYTNNQYYTDIANAIRSKNGSTTLYTPQEMAAAINALVVSGGSISLQNKTINPSESQQSITHDSGYNGLGTVTVNAISSTYVGTGVIRQAAQTITPSGSAQTAVAADVYTTGATTVAAVPTETKSISSNGTYTPTSGKWFSSVTVNVSSGGGGTTINNQNKTVTPSESEQSITYDSGYTGLGTVTVEAINANYVGSGITSRNSSDLSASGATVTAPAGYYASAASTSVSAITLPTAATSSATSGFSSKATIGRSTSDQYINIPTGYNLAGAYYKVSAVPNGSVTAPTAISGSSASVSTGTNTLTLSKTISVTPNVTTAGYVSGGTAGNSNVSLTASVTTKAAATITPGTTNQTINAGTYLTGAQTISGDANLIEENIKSGVSIFGKTGTYTGSGGGSGTSKSAQILQQGSSRVGGSSYTKACGDLTVSKAGTYSVYWTTYRTSTSGTWGTRLYKNSSAIDNEQTTFSSNYQTVHLSSISLAANDKIAVYAKTRGTNYYAYVGQLTIIEE